MFPLVWLVNAGGVWLEEETSIEFIEESMVVLRYVSGDDDDKSEIGGANDIANCQQEWNDDR